MNTKTKKKLCWNCEGEVLTTAVQCPYCGVNLEGVARDEEKPKEAFAPPYKLIANPTIPSSPYASQETPKEEEQEESAPQDSSTRNEKNIILSLLFLLGGAAFALFGLVLWLFADKTGHLHLRWNAHYWFAYLFISIPLLYLGWKASRSTQDDDSP